ncbi:uncharacterized protein LOC120268421 [Dioscorea cayenensis subsp. rotundata]|uniref:Uncharacterized protein LOC120268421 n=1 Tax=Dioscorea cayennensis subsp. rotundata TaxID=55577 RepID=A0AB40BWF2_DIOCR|nr:uncharacterized protein LOC120268421 [Dioscorea cayenensis subsp. rotundata]
MKVVEEVQDLLEDSVKAKDSMVKESRSLDEGSIIITTVTSSISSTASWLQSLIPNLCNLQTLIVGLDFYRSIMGTGTRRPSPLPTTFHEIDFAGRVIVMTCLILQLQHMDSILHILRDFLSDPSISFIGVGIMANVSKLLDDYDLQCGNPGSGGGNHPEKMLLTWHLLC